MKALPKKLLPLTLFGIAVTSVCCVQPAQGFTITMEQMGSNVVADGSGAINLTGLSFIEEGSLGPFINPHVAFIVTGQTGSGSTYDGFTGPTTFGNGVITLPNTSSGDLVGISNSSTPFPFLLVPQGYLSNTALSNSMTFNNATFASLGLTPGTYVWTWGTGLANQNFTLQIGSVGVPGVPDGGLTVSLLGFALLGLVALRRELRG